MLTWVARMSWYSISLLVPMLIPPVGFSMQLLERGTIPTSLLVLVETIFTSLVYNMISECADEMWY